MARASAASGDVITLRQFVTLRLIARAGGKSSTSDIRHQLAECGIEVTPIGNVGALKNMAKTGWLTMKKEERPVGVNETNMPTNIWKITPEGKVVMEKSKKVLTALLAGKKEVSK